jgi:hypothetical protein
MSTRILAALIVAASSFTATHTSAARGQQAQGAQPQAPSTPSAPPAGRGSSPFQPPEPLDYGDRTGWTSLFDGRTLTGWSGNPDVWRVENGVVMAVSTAERRVGSTHIIWMGGEPADFELKLEYRIDATNSGVQFRSVHLPAGTQPGRGAIAGQWVLKGYQCDIDAANRYSGQIYEERGRGFLAMRGQFTYIPDGGGPKVVGALQRNDDELLKIIKVNEWNQVHIIARGNLITSILNGQVMSALVDDDSKGRALKGLLGFQLHMGEPMKAEFRNIWLKQY